MIVEGMPYERRVHADEIGLYPATISTPHVCDAGLIHCDRGGVNSQTRQAAGYQKTPDATLAALLRLAKLLHTP